MPVGRRSQWAGAAALVSGVVVAAFAGTSLAASSCGIYAAGGRSWIVVANGVSCTAAKSTVRRFAAQTAALRSGQRVVVRRPPAGFACVLASRGKPGGSCSSAGATRSILWIAAS